MTPVAETRTVELVIQKVGLVNVCSGSIVDLRLEFFTSAVK